MAYRKYSASPLKVMSGFDPEVLTFSSDLANVVGLRGEDVDNMLDAVAEAKPFSSVNEQNSVHHAVKMHYNGLRFFQGPDLYHT